MTFEETAAFFRLCLPAKIANAIACLPENSLREIRVRALRPVCLVTADGVRTLPFAPTGEQVAYMAESLCEHALYARAEESRQGYVTLRGGHRMGLCGRVVTQGHAVRALREIGSLCIRVAAEWPGAADDVLRAARTDGQLGGALIVGLPGTGKTTLLRDICRQLSLAGRTVGVLDERGEIAACVDGVPQLDVGPHSDVLDGCGKAAGLAWLVRSMSPDALVTDELGGEGDAAAVLDAARCGVPVFASVHGREICEALQRAALAPLLQKRVFDVYALLDEGSPGRVVRLMDADGRDMM